MGTSTRRFQSVPPVALALALFVWAGCGDDSSGPQVANLTVTTSTTGADLDTDGYTVTVDGQLNQNILTSGTVTFSNLSTGSHTVELSGIAANCAVTGDNPRTVTVEAQGTTTTFAVGCNSLTGNLEATTLTTGVAIDPDGYTLVIDGTVNQAIGVNATATISDVQAGDRSVLLDGVADNCSVAGANPRILTVPTDSPTPGGGTVQTTFTVSCVQALGDLDVTTSTTGIDIDSDGYSVEVDGTLMQSIGVNGSVTFQNLTVGDHDVELVGIAPNCSVSGANPRTVSVPFAGTATAFDVVCAAASGALQVLTSTTGQNLDPNGYTVSVDGGTPQAIGINDAVTFSGLTVGDHDVQLAGLASNCGVFGDNPRTESVIGGATVQATFNVGCFAPLNGKIAFETDRSGDYEIFIMDPDGTDQTNITNVAGFDDRQPDVSPDGQKIAFASDRIGANNIFVMNPDGSGAVNLTSDVGGNNYTPAWSPDGTKIAWSRRSGGESEVWVMNADGSGKFNLTNNAAFDDEQPTWAPNSFTIAFQSDRDGDMEIYTVNLDGTGLAQVTNNPGFDFAPSWHPTDPNTLAFSADRSGPGEIWVINLITLVETNLTNNAASDFESDWSPSGSMIAFTSLRDGNPEVYTMMADGTVQARITFDSDVDGQAAWSP